MSISVEDRLTLIEERIEFIMHSVMIPRKVENKIVGPNNPPTRTVLIPLSVMWNALEEVKQRLNREKSAILSGQEPNNG